MQIKDPPILISSCEKIKDDWSGDLNYLQLILSMADMRLGWIFFVDYGAFYHQSVAAILTTR
jgi:hypothetical protein